MILVIARRTKFFHLKILNPPEIPLKSPFGIKHLFSRFKISTKGGLAPMNFILNLNELQLNTFLV
jgi:hypothetical protein